MGRAPAALWRGVGQVIDSPFVYPELTVRENLWAAARLHGAPRSEAAAAAEALLSECWESQRGDDGPLNTRARKAARTLARVYVALGDSARAQEYRDLGRNPDE